MEGGGGGGGLPPGFRFYPTEEELVSFYLKKKIQISSRTQDIDRVIPQIDVYEFNPWELPQYAGERCRRDSEQWFFFIPRQEKEARGGRPSRLTSSGYWKATGSPSSVYSSDHRVIGTKRTMVFYTGRAPTGKKTEWKMNEYKAIEEEASLKNTTPKLMQDLCLCRLYIASKCLRAFDRRPSAAAPNEYSGRVQQSDESNDQAITSSHLNHLSLTEGMKRSPDHSSNYSGEHATNPFDQSTMEIDGELSWDWEEHINWF